MENFRLSSCKVLDGGLRIIIVPTRYKAFFIIKVIICFQLNYSQVFGSYKLRWKYLDLGSKSRFNRKKITGSRSGQSRPKENVHTVHTVQATTRSGI
jgi:hypothetical protein